jgi:hypothetical protein
MSLKRVLSFDVDRVLLFDMNRILFFDLNRILLFDLNRILFWRIPPLMLIGLAGWFLASLALQMGIWSRGLAVFVSAASAGAFVLSLIGRLRAQR